LVAFNELPKTKIKCLAAKAWYWNGNQILSPQGAGDNPKRLLNKTVWWISRAHHPFLLKTT
jgi:hypothetical protein